MTSRDAKPDAASFELRPEVRKIIASGRTTGTVRTGCGRSAALLTASSLMMLYLSFTPVECAPLAWIALAPLCQLLRLKSMPQWFYSVTWVIAFVWATATLQWMRLGHPAMYLALVAMAAYIGLYIPAFVIIGRMCIARGLPLWLTVPIVWTALEYVRAYLLTGFSWYYLGHTQYRWLSLIQISDITGAYGVSFVVALVSGVLAARVPLRWLKTLNLDVDDSGTAALSLIPVCTTVLILAMCFGYAAARQTRPEDIPAGPVFALIQGNFTPEIKHDDELQLTRYRVHDALMQRSVLMQPDFIVWPETMFPWPEHSVAEGVTDEQILASLPPEAVRSYGNESALLAERFRTNEIQNALAQHSQASGAALVMGLEARFVGKDRLSVYNAAAFVRPDLGYVGRYDKIHRVIFGEYIPLKSVFPLITNLTPFGAEFGIDAGNDVRLFEYAGYRIAPLICFEDTVPHLVCRMAAQKDEQGRECDVLVNLTNDAWFRGSSELDQHLITAAFRCVETRTPMVRCVNGGISAFIDGNGQIREPDQIQVLSEPLEGLRPELTEVSGMRDPATGSWRRQFSGIIVGQAPLDPRDSLYIRFGDWFAMLCAVVTAGCLFLSFRRTAAQ